MRFDSWGPAQGEGTPAPERNDLTLWHPIRDQYQDATAAPGFQSIGPVILSFLRQFHGLGIFFGSFLIVFDFSAVCGNLVWTLCCSRNREPPAVRRWEIVQGVWKVFC